VAVAVAVAVAGCGWSQNHKDGVKQVASQGFETGLAKSGNRALAIGHDR
jgi:hypothetical protein